MSDTPRTDRHLHNPVVYNGDDGPYAAMDVADYGEWVPSWLSCYLEREITELQRINAIKDGALTDLQQRLTKALADLGNPENIPW